MTLTSRTKIESRPTARAVTDARSKFRSLPGGGEMGEARMSYYHQGHFYRTDEWGTVVQGPADGAWPTQPGYKAPEPAFTFPQTPALVPTPYKREAYKTARNTYQVKRNGLWLPTHLSLDELRAGDQVVAETGLATIYPEADFETFSEAGYVWNAEEEKWDQPFGLGAQNRGLKAVGTRNYVEHPSFRVLSLAWNLKDGKGVRWWRPDHEYWSALESDTIEGVFKPRNRDATFTNPWEPGELYDYIASGGILEAWNINFEYVVWNFHMTVKHNAPFLRQEQCSDAMAKSRAAAYPGALAEFGKVRSLTNQKDPKGTALVRKLTTPRKPTKANRELRLTPLTAREDFQVFYEYNRQDIRAEAEASAKTPDLTDRERVNWLFDLRCNMRGMQIDTQSVEDCISIILQAEHKGNAELRTITNGHVQKYTEVADILSWCRMQGVTLAKLDKEALEAALDRKDYPRNVLRVLRIRQELAFGSVRKYFALRAATTPYSRLYDQYVYYGAHTSLWNGRDVQPANLYKGVFSKPEQVERALQLIRCRNLELIEWEYGEGSQWAKDNPDIGPLDALEVIASCLRSMIVARPGHKLISADFTAIQAVGTSCMANEQWRIDVFRTHGKIYEAMMSKLRGVPLQYYLDFKKQHGKHHPDRQVYGKMTVLSGDFGSWIGGWRKLDKEKCLGTDDEVKKLILDLWQEIPNVRQFWGGQTWDKFGPNETPLLYGLEGAAVSAILEPGTCFNSRPGSHLGVEYVVHEDILYCRPPSGGFIRYHSPRLRPSTRNHARVWEYEITYQGYNTNTQKGPVGWIDMKLYGGVQTQNVISHMCREIQANALVALDERYPIVMHTHDEQLAEVPDRPEFNAEDYTRLVRESLPAWAVCLDGQPWPIKVPLAWEAYRYGKWED